MTILLFAAAIPTDDAARAFEIARGFDICGPIIIVDRGANEVVANQADAQGVLKRDGVVWRGTFPPEIQPANTALEWAGVRWTEVQWPLPSDSRARAQLLGHECYHRIQDKLRLPANNPLNGHLDTQKGRVWMQLEWRALERALLTTGVARKTAVADAIRFRGWRQFPDLAAGEAALEMNEGLAEDRGVMLANPNSADRIGAAVYQLRTGPRAPSFVRSFAYATGPAYCILLDAAAPGWRKKLRPDSDLGQIAAEAYGIRIYHSAEPTAAAKTYGGDVLIEEETARARKQEVVVSELRARYITGPVVTLPVMKQFYFAFDPNGLVSLGGELTVYRNLGISDEWGTLKTSAGLIVRENGLIRRIVVPAADTGTLNLKPGFRKVPGARPGDFEVRPE